MRKAASKGAVNICWVAFLGFCLSGCATKRASPSPELVMDPALAVDLSHLNEFELWTVSALPTFGEENADMIRVFIAGEVNRSGIYYVHQGTNVAGLIELTMGRKQSNYGGNNRIVRKDSLGQREQLDFPGTTGVFERFQQIILSNEDFVFLV